MKLTIEADDLDYRLKANLANAAALGKNLEQVADCVRTFATSDLWIITQGGHHVALSWKLPVPRRVAIITDETA